MRCLQYRASTVHTYLVLYLTDKVRTMKLRTQVRNFLVAITTLEAVYSYGGLKGLTVGRNFHFQLRFLKMIFLGGSIK